MMAMSTFSWAYITQKDCHKKSNDAFVITRPKKILKNKITVLYSDRFSNKAA